MNVVANPVHPGEFIREMYLEGSSISDAEFARYLGVSPSAVCRLLNCKSDLSIDMAMRLSKVCGRSAESWMMMQVRYSVIREKQSPVSTVNKLKRLPVVIE